MCFWKKIGTSNSVQEAEGGSPPSVIRKEGMVSTQQDMVNPATVPGNVTGLQSSAPSAAWKRKLRRTLDPLTAEIIELPPSALLASHNFICRVCSKSFQREQNLQLHMRGHKLPWKLKLRTITEDRKRIYICPEATCQRHNPAFGLGDFPGIRKHFCRKHGERKWKCGKCPKAYAVRCDLKAHTKICGQKKYRCDCGSSYARKVSFMAHKRSCKGPMKEEDEVKQQEESPTEGNIQHTDTAETGAGAGGAGSGFQMPDLNHDTGYATGSKFTVLDWNRQPGNPQVAFSDDHMATSCMNMEGVCLASSGSSFEQTSFNPYSLDLHLGRYGMTRVNYMNYENGSPSGSGGGSGGGGGGLYKSQLAWMQTAAQMDAISNINSDCPRMLQTNFVSDMAPSGPNPTCNNWPYAGNNTEQITSTVPLTHQTSQEQYHQIPHLFEVGDEYYSTQLPQNQIAGFPYQYCDNIMAIDNSLLPYNPGMHSSSATLWLPIDGEHCFPGKMVFENIDELQNQDLNMGMQGVHQLAHPRASIPGFTWDGIGTTKPETGDGMEIDFSIIGPEPWIVHEEYQHQQLPMEFNHGSQEVLQNEQLPHFDPSIEKAPSECMKILTGGRHDSRGFNFHLKDHEV